MQFAGSKLHIAVGDAPLISTTHTESVTVADTISATVFFITIHDIIL